MRVHLSAAFAIALLTAGVSARQSQIATEQRPGLLVDFTAVLADGTPAGELQPADVAVKINGRSRVVRAVRRISTAPQAGPGPAPAFGTSNTLISGRSFVFIVDEESLMPTQRLLIANAVEGLVSAFTPADQAMVVALPFAGVKTAFTSDTARIRLAVSAISAHGSRNETGSDLACRTRRFLESLDAFLTPYAGRPSPMTIVLFTAGMGAPRRDAPAALAPGMCELLVDHYRRITAAAGAARANFFVVQPDDIAQTSQRWRESIGGTGYLGSDNPLEGIENMAGVTGGVRLPLNATGTGALQRVTRETSAYFVAEIERDANEVMDRSRPLSVRVLKRGVTARARPEITFTGPRPGTRTTRLALPDLLGSREAFTDVPLRAAGFTLREPDGRLRLGVVVEPADDAVELASLGAVLLDKDDVVARWIAGDMLGRPLVGAMAVNPGSYRLRVVAIDKAGQVGAAEEAITVGLTPVGPLSLGSLMLGISRHDTVVPQLQFSTEPSAIASFDIYGGQAGMPMAAAVEVARDAEGPALLSLPLALRRVDDTRVIATGAVPIGALPAGDYVVRGVIRLDDGATGRVTRTLRKVAQ
jgi:hypothetical protein